MTTPPAGATGTSSSDYVYVFSDVRDLAHTYLPRNRGVQAQKVDRMLQQRDTRIAELQTEVTNRGAAIERYMHENAQLRALIGQLRTAMNAALIGELQHAVRTLAEALAREIPMAWRPRDGKDGRST